MSITISNEMIRFDLVTVDYCGPSQILASISMAKEFMSREDIVAKTMTRLIQELQLKRNLPTNKRIEVVATILPAE